MPSKARSMDQLPSKREQQVMEIVHRLGRATAHDVHQALPDASSYNAVRGVLTALEEKGRLVHAREGRRYVYRPAVPSKKTARVELSRIVRTFFDGSKARLVSALLAEEAPTPEELEQLRRLIEEHRTASDEESGP